LGERLALTLQRIHRIGKKKPKISALAERTLFVGSSGQNRGVSKKLTFEQAAKIMRAAKLEPIGEYPGRLLPWKCKCLQCGKIVTPSLGAVKTNGGGCRECGFKNAAKSRLGNEKEAIAIMKKAGALPLEPFAGNRKPWLCKCLTCKKEITPTLGNVKNNGTNPCVYCSKKKVHPDDAVQLMKKAGLEPLVPYPGSNKKWKCRHTKCGEIVYPMHSWIVSGSGGCLKCGYIKTKEKQMNSDQDARAFFLSRGLDPIAAYPGAGKPWKSKCKKCKQVVSPTYNSIKSGSGCGVCGGKIVVPEIAAANMMNALLEPLAPYPGGKTKWKSKCMKCGKIVYPNYGDILRGDGGCKYCGGHFIEPEDAVATMKFNNLEPLEPYTNTGTPWKCRCLKCGKTVTPRHNSIQRGSGGCKYCAKRFVDAEEAILLMRKAKLEPLEPFPGSNKPWKCKCLRCTRDVQPAYTAIQRGQKGCVYCGGKKVDPEEAFTFMVSKGLTPLEPYKRADGKWKCRCIKCLKLVTPKYSTLKQGAFGCIYCSGKKVDPQDAIALFLENSLRPLVPYKSTETKWKSECMKCGRIVYPSHHMVSQRSGGCKYCATQGLDFTLPAFIYLITNEELGAHKIGISGMYSKEDRLNDHARNGWKLYKRKTLQSADHVYEIEQETLRWLRVDRSLPPYLSKDQVPQAGWTETVDASEIDLPTIWAKVEEISRGKK
jgi:recombinational DNA repair protein (RecF pathway)